MITIKYEPQEDPIKTYFPEGHWFKEVTVKPDIMPNDIVVLKPNFKASRHSMRFGDDISSTKWKVSKVRVVIDEDYSYHTIVEWIDGIRDEKHPYSEWAENIPSEYIEVVERKYEPYEQKLFLPYEVGEIIWNFPNHLYDCFTPKRLRVEKYAWYVGQPSVSLMCAEWTYDSTKRGYTDWNFKSRYSWGYYSLYWNGSQDKEIIYRSLPIVKEILSNKTNLIYFANKTYNKDSFRDCEFGKPYYEKLMEDVGLTFDDLITASKASISSKPKKTTTKKKTPKTDKPKVEDIFNGLTEKQKKEMLKLLQNGK